MTTQSTAVERSRTQQILDIAQKFGAIPLAIEAIAQGKTVSEFQAIALQRFRHNSTGFKFGRAVSQLFRDPLALDGFERECLAEWSGGPENFDVRRWPIPWHEIKRDLHVATASAGGYMTDSQTLEPRDILRPWSATARSGIEIISNVKNTDLLPITTAKSSVTWLADEATSAIESTPTIGQAAGEPKIAIGVIEFSRQFAQQTRFEPWIRRELARTAATALDQGLLNGSGASGEMLGLMNTSGVATVTGTSFTHAKSLEMKRAPAEANVDDANISFMAAPATRETLEGREIGTDSGRFVWQADQVADRAARVSTDVPSATLIAGDWSQGTLLLYGAGVEIEFNAFDSAKFKSGILQARVLIACDCIFPVPAAFSISTAIT